MRFSLATPIRFAKRHVLAFGIGAAALILVLGSLLFVVPRYREVHRLGGLSYVQTQKQVDAQKTYLEELRGLRDQLSAISPDDIDRLDLIVPRGKDVPGVFKQMQAFAREAGMNLLSVSVSDGGSVIGATGTSGNLRSLTVSVILAGALDYPGLKNFLAVVSRQAPLLDLTAISHSPGSSSAPTSYNFSFRSYFFEK